jgi:ribosomal protein L40E
MTDIYICPNCEAQNSPQAKFCIECSQKTHLKLKSVWRLMFDFFANLIDYDSKLFSSVKGLFKPGFLTKQYLAKKRVSYLTPIRMFIIAMLAMFALMSFLNIDNIFQIKKLESGGIHFGVNNTKNGVKTEERDKSYTLLDEVYGKLKVSSLIEKLQKELVNEINSVETSITKLSKKEQSQTDIQKNKILDTKINKKTSYLNHLKSSLEKLKDIGSLLKVEKNETIHMALFGSNYEIDVVDFNTLSYPEIAKKYKVNKIIDNMILKQMYKFNHDSNAFLSFLFQNLTWVIFVELLLVSVLFKLFYIRTKRKYVEHFIFNLNIHSFLFVVSIIVLLIPFSFPGWLVLSILVGLFSYIFLSLKNVYQQSYFITILKILLILFIDVFIIVFSFIMVLFITSLFF